MTVRLLSIAITILAGLLAVLLLDLVFCPAEGAFADERKNCPSGFSFWRWGWTIISGTCLFFKFYLIYVSLQECLI